MDDKEFTEWLELSRKKGREQRGKPVIYYVSTSPEAYGDCSRREAWHVANIVRREVLKWAKENGHDVTIRFEYDPGKARSECYGDPGIKLEIDDLISHNVYGVWYEFEDD